MTENQRDTLQAAVSRLCAAIDDLYNAIIEGIMPTIKRVIELCAISADVYPDAVLKASAEKPKHYYLYKHGKRRVRKKWGRVLKKRASERLQKEK